MGANWFSVKWATVLAVIALSGTGCGLCGIRCSGFLTPVYDVPSGYSETYREHLEQTDPRPVRKVLLDPTLVDNPSTKPPIMRPVPKPKLMVPPPPGRSDAPGSRTFDSDSGTKSKSKTR